MSEGGDKESGFISWSDRFRKWKDSSAEEIRRRTEETIRRADERVRQGADNLQTWKGQRSSLIWGDSVDRLRDSSNPLVKLEERKIPRHVSTSMVAFAAASGVFKSADEISRFTRDLMDCDLGAVQQWLRRVFDPEQAREISMWMDASAGGAAFGGWAHRLEHGHDLTALLTLSQEYGHVGAVEWVNHVWMRDFWTPHGVPYLPAGSGSVYEWLVGMGVSPSTAMGLLSVNAAEMASGLLFFYSGHRFRRGINAFVGNRNYKRRLKRIDELVTEGSEAEALRLVDETETFSNNDRVPTLRLDLAVYCLGRSFNSKEEQAPAWGSRSFSIAFDLCRSTPSFPKNVPYHGNTQVSFQGLAATIMAAAYSSYLQRSNSDWSQVSERIQFGIRRFLALARIQSSQSRWAKFQEKQVAGYRPYSALTNLLLALELSISCGSLHSIGVDPLTIRRQLSEILAEIREQGAPHEAVANEISLGLRRVYPLG